MQKWVKGVMQGWVLRKWVNGVMQKWVTREVMG
jgi:hypothetical protein